MTASRLLRFAGYLVVVFTPGVVFAAVHPSVHPIAPLSVVVQMSIAVAIGTRYSS